MLRAIILFHTLIHVLFRVFIISPIYRSRLFLPLFSLLCLCLSLLHRICFALSHSLLHPSTSSPPVHLTDVRLSGEVFKAARFDLIFSLRGENCVALSLLPLSHLCYLCFPVDSLFVRVCVCAVLKTVILLSFHTQEYALACQSKANR